MSGHFYNLAFLVRMCCLVLGFDRILADVNGCSLQGFRPCICNNDSTDSDANTIPDQCGGNEDFSSNFSLPVRSMQLTLMVSNDQTHNGISGNNGACRSVRLQTPADDSKARRMHISITPTVSTDSNRSYCRRVPVICSTCALEDIGKYHNVKLPVFDDVTAIRMHLVTSDIDDKILGKAVYLVTFSSLSQDSWINPVVAMTSFQGYLQITLTPPLSEFISYITYTVTLVKCINQKDPPDRKEEGSSPELELWNHAHVDSWTNGQCRTSLDEAPVDFDFKNPLHGPLQLNIQPGNYQLWVDSILIDPHTEQRRHVTLRTPTFVIQTGTNISQDRPAGPKIPNLLTVRTDANKLAFVPIWRLQTESPDGGNKSSKAVRSMVINNGGGRVKDEWLFPTTLTLSLTLLIVCIVCIASFWWWRKQKSNGKKLYQECKSTSDRNQLRGDTEEVTYNTSLQFTKPPIPDDVKSFPVPIDVLGEKEIGGTTRYDGYKEIKNQNQAPTFDRSAGNYIHPHRHYDRNNFCNISMLLDTWSQADSLFDTFHDDNIMTSLYDPNCGGCDKQPSSGYFSQECRKSQVDGIKKPKLALSEDISLTSTVLEEKLRRHNEDCLDDDKTDSTCSDLQDTLHPCYECISLTDAMPC